MTGVATRGAWWTGVRFRAVPTVRVALLAGAAAGLVIGGVGGRLAMALLRVTSPDVLDGVATDDGFAIGTVSLDTLNLLVATTVVGAVAGVAYAATRWAVPPRARVPLWSALCAAAGGNLFVRGDGLDFRVLTPLWLAVGLFVALPAAAGAATAWLTERRLAGAHRLHSRAAQVAPGRLAGVASQVVTLALVLATVASGASLTRTVLELAG